MAYLFRTNSKCEKWAQRKPALGRSEPDIPTRNNFVLNLRITAINNINDGSPNPENEYRLCTDFPKKVWKTAQGKWKIHNQNHHLQDHLDPKEAQINH